MAERRIDRRARASRDVWATRVGAWRRSGVSAGRFCRGRGFAVSTLRWWAWRLGSSGDAVASAGLVRVEVNSPEPAKESPGFAVVFPDGIEIRVAPSFDAEPLARLLACVEGRRRC